MSEETKTPHASVVPPRPSLIAPLPLTLPSQRGRSTLAKVLPTDRVSFDKQKELIRAFAAEYAANGGQPVTNDKAGELIGLSGSTISQTNGFFCDIGLVVRSDLGGFIPSPETVEYNTACQWSESEARAKLRPIIERTWFYRCLIPRLHISAQPTPVCLSVLANESKAQPEHNDRLVCLINYLELAGIVSESGGMVSLQQARPQLANVPRDDKKPLDVGRLNGEFSDQEENSFFLDKDKKRKVTLNCPLSISKAEYVRITKWIDATWIIEGQDTSE
jgi:hypothetical protein